MTKPQLKFASEKAFRTWLMKNHSKAEGVWIEFVKSGYGENGLKQQQAVDQALCFGWTFGVLKSVDHAHYSISFTPRKKKSSWSAGMVKRFKQLQRKGLIHSSGADAFKNRKKSVYENPDPEFSKAQEGQFKKNKKAWSYFSNQTESYRKYMILWVVSAKREETQRKRLEELIRDSGNEMKLKRLVDATERFQEKQKTRYPANQTPIETAKNIGPKTGAELRSLGIETVEHLKREGWENVALRWCEMYPERVNLMALQALIGAAEDQSVRALDAELRAEARALLGELRRNRL